MSQMDVLKAFLDAKETPFSVPPSGTGLVVHGSLRMMEASLRALPDNLTVEGRLHLGGSNIERLPENLVLSENLCLGGARIAMLPNNLSVGGDLWLERRGLLALPSSFRARGTLDVRNTALRELPEGLDVAGDLDLRGTFIQKFPEEMRVGGKIFAPHTLLHITRFMDTQPGNRVISLDGSRHALLALRAELAPFPDLSKTVFSHVGTSQNLYIDHLYKSKYSIHFGGLFGWKFFRSMIVIFDLRWCLPIYFQQDFA